MACPNNLSLRMTTPRLTLWIDDYELTDFLPVAAEFGARKLGYVVTPNVDHMLRYHDDPEFNEVYQRASYVLLDSRFAAILLRLWKGTAFRVCPGSDLGAALFTTPIAREQPLVLIGGSAEQAAELKARFGLRDLRHFNPPFGFIRDPAAVEECMKFVESNSPFGYCVLAVGTPQQEILALRLAVRDKARGLVFCIGAAVDFITGKQRRAPLWMQRAGLEWLFRLLQNPSRLAHRYLVRGPRVFGLLRTMDVRARPVPAPSQRASF